MCLQDMASVRIETCGKTFGNGTRAVKFAMLDSARGEMLVLLGPSGCGKATNAPVPAARNVLAKAWITLDDIDLLDINEAFAVVIGKFIRIQGTTATRSMSTAAGATGLILIDAILEELERRDLRHGLVTIFAVGGMAPAS
jgi:acetyl-CoA acetyltransferase